MDVGLCLDVLTNVEIFEAISEDNATIEHLKVDVLADIWLKIEVDGLLVGVVQFKHVFTNCFDCHIHILPQHRKNYSLLAGENIVGWCTDNMVGKTLFATVPTYCKSVVNYLKRFDFSNSGIIPKAWTKNKTRYDLLILSRGF